VFVDFTAAYDTVWDRGLTCKLLQLPLGRHMDHMIMEMVGNRSFTLSTRNCKWSRWRPTGICPGAITVQHLHRRSANNHRRKYAYADDDDLAIMHADGDCQAVEWAQTNDMLTVGEYLQTWKLKFSTTKTVSAVFILNNKEAKRELKVKYNKTTLLFCSEPKYFRVTLDRSLTYRQHLKSLRKKLTSCSTLLRRLAGSSWGAGAATLSVSTLAWYFQPQSTALLCLVPQCSYSPRRPRHQRRLVNCDWMPALHTSGQSSNPRRYPTC